MCSVACVRGEKLSGNIKLLLRCRRNNNPVKSSQLDHCIECDGVWTWAGGGEMSRINNRVPGTLLVCDDLRIVRND